MLLDRIDPATKSEITFLHEDSKRIIVNTIRTPEEFRAMGGAGRNLSYACGYADAAGITLLVYPVPDLDSPLNQTQLQNWYFMYGFRPVVERRDRLCLKRNPMK